MFEPISKNAVDVDVLKDALKEVPVGETIAYRDLSKLVGRDVQGKHRYLLVSACDRLLKERKMVFGSVFKIGIKRLTPDESVSQASHVLKRIRSIAKRGAAKIAATDYNSLSSDDLKRMHNGYLSLLAAVVYSADSRHLNRLTGPVTNTNPAVLPTAKTLSLLAS